MSQEPEHTERMRITLQSDATATQHDMVKRLAGDTAKPYPFPMEFIYSAQIAPAMAERIAALDFVEEVVPMPTYGLA